MMKTSSAVAYPTQKKCWCKLIEFNTNQCGFIFESTILKLSNPKYLPEVYSCLQNQWSQQSKQLQRLNQFWLEFLLLFQFWPTKMLPKSRTPLMLEVYKSGKQTYHKLPLSKWFYPTAFLTQVLLTCKRKNPVLRWNENSKNTVDIF